MALQSTSGLHQIPLTAPGEHHRLRDKGSLLDVSAAISSGYMTLTLSLAISVCAGSVTLGPWAKRGTCSLSVLLLQVLGRDLSACHRLLRCNGLACGGQEPWFCS